MTETCKQCGEPIVGQAFGSPQTGWRHPFTCPRDDRPNPARTGDAVIAAAVARAEAQDAAKAALAKLPHLRYPIDDTAYAATIRHLGQTNIDLDAAVAAHREAMT